MDLLLHVFLHGLKLFSLKIDRGFHYYYSVNEVSYIPPTPTPPICNCICIFPHYFHSCTMHLDTIKSFVYPTDAQLDCSKMLKFTLKFT